MSLRTKKEDRMLREKLSATEKHIQKNLDGTDWNALLKSHNFCGDCPTRTGPEIIWDGNMINDYCMSCPLRQWLLVTCELAMRQRQKNKTAPENSEGGQNQTDVSSSGDDGGK